MVERPRSGIGQLSAQMNTAGDCGQAFNGNAQALALLHIGEIPAERGGEFAQTKEPAAGNLAEMVTHPLLIRAWLRKVGPGIAQRPPDPDTILNRIDYVICESAGQVLVTVEPARH
jgi:hypothetical protein